jgi:hypothetical protein
MNACMRKQTLYISAKLITGLTKKKSLTGTGSKWLKAGIRFARDKLTMKLDLGRDCFSRALYSYHALERSGLFRKFVF